MTEETCFLCDQPTGRAGRLDDSLYDEDDCGPYCEDCWVGRFGDGNDKGDGHA